MARRKRSTAPLCVTCGFQLAHRPSAECSTCLGYRRRTGLQRPPDVIAVHARRLLAGPIRHQPKIEPAQLHLPISA